MPRIDKSMLPFGIAHRIVDKAYRKHLSMLPCAVCGAEDGTVVGAHIRAGNEGGMSLKPSDDLQEPLCHKCHADQEANPGPEWWFENTYKPKLRDNYRYWKMG